MSITTTIEDRENIQDQHQSQNQIERSTQDKSSLTQSQAVVDDIEYVPAAFKDILDSISLPSLVSSHTFFAWRLGVSDRFIDEALLPKLRDEGFVTVIVPMLRSFWLANMKPPSIMPVKSLRSRKPPTVLASSEFLSVYDAITQQDALKVIKQIVRQMKPMSLSSNISRIVVLVEILGPLNQELAIELRLLMRDGLSKGVILWLHAEVANVPREYLDQFHNHIVILPSQAEIAIFDHTQTVPSNEIEENGGNRNVTIVNGPCVPHSRTWKVIRISTISEVENYKQREWIQRLLNIKLINMVKLKIKLSSEFADERYAPPDARRPINTLEQEIEELKRQLSYLTEV